jgi:hypothetical protein
LAEPPHGKAAILHCGCVLDADDNVGMAYVEISVSSKAKGHTKHAIGATESCVTADGGLADFVREGEDCQLGGSELVGLQQCGGQTAGGSCGSQVLPLATTHSEAMGRPPGAPFFYEDGG